MLEKSKYFKQGGEHMQYIDLNALGEKVFAQNFLDTLKVNSLIKCVLDEETSHIGIIKAFSAHSILIESKKDTTITTVKISPNILTEQSILKVDFQSSDITDVIKEHKDFTASPISLDDVIVLKGSPVYSALILEIFKEKLKLYVADGYKHFICHVYLNRILDDKFKVIKLK